jgi:hypothetical protein
VETFGVIAAAAADRRAAEAAGLEAVFEPAGSGVAVTVLAGAIRASGSFSAELARHEQPGSSASMLAVAVVVNAIRACLRTSRRRSSGANGEGTRRWTMTAHQSTNAD